MGFEVSHVAQATANGREIGQRTTQPALGNVQLIRAGGFLLDGLLGLLLGAHKENLATGSDSFDHVVVGAVEAVNGLL